MRCDGRMRDELRPVSIEPGYLAFADGSALITFGKTRVLCAATIQESVPAWMAGQGRGWITGEYAMLPASTSQRTPRETQGFSGRTQEIRRLIGRSLRAAVDLGGLGERLVTVDCDVLQADGGTRTASVTGGQVALHLAFLKLAKRLGDWQAPAMQPVAAVSVGVVGDACLLDLCYEEDSTAEVDFNVVMNAEGEYIEVQGTAEGRSFARSQLDELLDLAQAGISDLQRLQQEAVARAVAEHPEVYLGSHT